MSCPSFPDIQSVEPDLTVPPLENGHPAAGRRVKRTARGYQDTAVYHALYLPADWQPSGRYPVIVEYAGNKYTNRFGDVSTGRVDGSCLGYGITGGSGAIWVCMPYVDSEKGENSDVWWGDLPATIDYCEKTVAEICGVWGGDPARVILAGFSRGAIACNYIGLDNDRFAALWRGFIAYDHYDGVIEWNYPGSDRVSAQQRLARLGNRPQFICYGPNAPSPEAYLREVCPDGDFTFQFIPFRNHNDAWVLRDIPERKILFDWYHAVTNR